MSNFNNEQLWKIIQRYDGNINATNTKASFLIGYNTFLVGTSLLGWKKIIDLHPKDTFWNITSSSLIMLLLAITIYSSWKVFCVVFPYLKAGDKTKNKKYTSLIFFGDVSKQLSAQDYADAVNKATKEHWENDLANQVYTLSEGLNNKFKHLKTAFRCTLFGQIPIFILILISIVIPLI